MSRYIDGRTGTRLYNIWRGIKKRCNDLDNPKYGGRGIGYCEEWEHYPVFRAWALQNGYAETLSIERLDNDSDYAPGNCCWVTLQAQARNRRNTRWVTVGDDTRSLAEWCERQGLPQSRVLARITKLGWSAEKALGLH